MTDKELLAPIDPAEEQEPYSLKLWLRAGPKKELLQSQLAEVLNRWEVQIRSDLSTAQCSTPIIVSFLAGKRFGGQRVWLVELHGATYGPAANLHSLRKRGPLKLLRQLRAETGVLQARLAAGPLLTLQ